MRKDQSARDNLSPSATISWDDVRVSLVWAMAKPHPWFDSAEYRVDKYDNLICRRDYGNRNSPFGWEIDHHPIPKALGGSDELWNLRPLHYRQNIANGRQVIGIAALLGIRPERQEPSSLETLLGIKR